MRGWVSIEGGNPNAKTDGAMSWGRGDPKLQVPIVGGGMMSW